LPDGKMNDLELDGLFVNTDQTGERILDRNSYLAAPYMTAVTGTKTAGGNLIITGMYFGTKAPKAYVEMMVSSKPKYKACKVVNSFRFTDAVGKPSCMKVFADTGVEPVGYSEITVVYPTIPKGAEPTGKIVIDNSTALAVY